MPRMHVHAWPHTYILTHLRITPLQNILLLAITAPAYVAWQYRTASAPNWLDGLATLLLGSFIVMEGVADQQQWSFQVGEGDCRLQAGTGRQACGHSVKIC